MIAREGSHSVATLRAEFHGFSSRGLVRLSEAKADAAFGLVLGSAGPGNAGDRDGQLCVGMGERAFSHFARNLLGDRAGGIKRLWANAKKFYFRIIRIGYEATFNYIR